MLSKTTNLPPSSSTTSMKQELLIYNDHSTAVASTDSLHPERAPNLVNPIAPELIPEPRQFVIVHETFPRQYETLKPFMPPPSTSANETMLPACGTLLLNHSTELITTAPRSYTNNGM